MKKVYRSTMVCLAASLITLTPARALSGQEKTFETKDGVKIVADVYPQSTQQKSPTVVLLHMLGHSRQDYKALVPVLMKQGFSVIAMDLRGHGQSNERTNNTRVQYQSFTRTDWGKLPEDLKRFLDEIQALPGIDGKKLALVGASIGGNTSALVAAEDTRVKAIVLLSPGLDYHGLQPSAAMKSLKRPAYIVVGKADQYSASSSKDLAQMNPDSKLEVLETKAHGTDLLTPELNEKLAAWLKEKTKD